jgi:FtsP/CotA-like multicopper oxidase with cupredoxin domain
LKHKFGTELIHFFGTFFDNLAFGTQFVAVSSGGMAHPLHFHGTKFRVLQMGFAEQHKGNGTIKGLNRHLECTKSNVKTWIKEQIKNKIKIAQMPCWELRWKNGTTTGDGKNAYGTRKNDTKRDTIVVPAKGFVVFRLKI